MKLSVSVHKVFTDGNLRDSHTTELMAVKAADGKSSDVIELGKDE